MWPTNFERIPGNEPWVVSRIDELARRYDDVQHHGWYRNLEPTLDDLQTIVHEDDMVIDYSAGTGILVQQFLRRVPNVQARFILVDSSPKFLRLALEKLGADERCAFRTIGYLKNERRLQLLDEVLPPSIINGGIDALCSTNAIHLYTNLVETLRSWARVLKPGAIVCIQSGNIGNPNAPENSWIIDTTVERLQPVAHALVRSDARYAAFREHLDDDKRMKAYDQLRHKYFLPVRPLAYYVDALRAASLEIVEVYELVGDAMVTEWGDFLSAYHEGVLGWAGGSKRIDDQSPSAEAIACRKQLLHDALSSLFAGQPSFPVCWTYIRCRKPPGRTAGA